MGFYKTQDINKEVTKLVKQYIDNGYWFAMDRMNCSYAHVEGTVQLTNGKEHIRIQLIGTTSTLTSTSREYKYVDTLVIKVEKSEHKAFRNNNEIEILDQTFFYRLNKETYVDNSEVWIDNKEK